MQDFLQKDVKFGPGKEHKDFGFNLLLVLLLSIQGFLIEKCSDKKENWIVVLGSRCGKIVLTLIV